MGWLKKSVSEKWCGFLRLTRDLGSATTPMQTSFRSPSPPSSTSHFMAVHGWNRFGHRSEFGPRRLKIWCDIDAKTSWILVVCPCKWEQGLLQDAWRVIWETVNSMHCHFMSASHRNQPKGTTQSLQSPDRPGSKFHQTSHPRFMAQTGMVSWSRPSEPPAKSATALSPILEPIFFSPVFMCFALIIYRLKLWNVQHVASLRSSEWNSGNKIFTKSPNITTSGSSSSERQGAYCKNCRVRCFGTMKSRSVDRSASTKKKSVAGFSEKLRKVPHRVCVLDDECVWFWYFVIHPGRSTWNIIMEVWKIIFLSKWLISRFHVNLPGCIWMIFGWLLAPSRQRTKRRLRLSMTLSIPVGSWKNPKKVVAPVFCPRYVGIKFSLHANRVYFVVFLFE